MADTRDVLRRSSGLNDSRLLINDYEGGDLSPDAKGIFIPLGKENVGCEQSISEREVQTLKSLKGRYVCLYRHPTRKDFIKLHVGLDNSLEFLALQFKHLGLERLNRVTEHSFFSNDGSFLVVPFEEQRGKKHCHIYGNCMHLAVFSFSIELEQLAFQVLRIGVTKIKQLSIRSFDFNGKCVVWNDEGVFTSRIHVFADGSLIAAMIKGTEFFVHDSNCQEFIQAAKHQSDIQGYTCMGKQKFLVWTQRSIAIWEWDALANNYTKRSQKIVTDNSNSTDSIRTVTLVNQQTIHYTRSGDPSTFHEINLFE